MDVVSHLAFGRALVALAHYPPAPATTRRALTAAIVVGAIAPDMDAVLMPFGWDRYLVWHERGTHTLFGILIVAALLASVLRFVIQPILKRPRTPWRLLWLAAIVGCASHLLLDAVCGGSLHPLWPLTDARLSFSLVGMADPLLALPLVFFLIAAAVSRRRAYGLAILLFVEMTGTLATKAVYRQMALWTYERHVPRIAERTIEARWASVNEWFVYDRAGSMVRTWEVNASTGRAQLYLQRDINPGSPEDKALIEASLKLDTVRRARSLFEFSFPEVITREDGTFDVLWSDIRFCRKSACDLRFGGRFDGEGRAIEQVVLIGTVRQTRPVNAEAGVARVARVTIGGMPTTGRSRRLAGGQEDVGEGRPVSGATRVLHLQAVTLE